jgi:hypothetical protein
MAADPKKPLYRIAARPPARRYLFGVKSLAKAFKHRYISELKALHAAGKLKFPAKTAQLSCPTAFGKLVARLEKQDWNVYAKRPFAGPEQVLDYLGRYTHRVAISNHRIESMQDNKVTFTYRDRADGDQLKQMTLDAVLVYPPFFAACAARRLCQNPILRLSGASQPQKMHCADPPTDRSNG